MGEIFKGLFYGSLVLCAFSSSGVLGHDLDDDLDEDGDFESSTYRSPTTYQHFTPAPTPTNATRVESIKLLTYEREKISAEVLKEADTYIAKLEAEDFFVREEGSKKLVELGKKSSGLFDYLTEKLASPQPPESRYRLAIAKSQLAPRATWEQIRWSLFSAVRDSDHMTAMRDGLDSVFAKLTAEEKKALSSRIPENGEGVIGKSKIVTPLPTEYTAREKALNSMLDEEMKAFTRAATDAGYEVIPGKVQPYMLIRTLTLTNETSTWKVDFNRNHNVRVMYSAVLPMESVPLQASKLFPEDLLLPNNLPAHSIGEVQLYGRILFTYDGTRQFVVQSSPTVVAFVDDPLFAPTQVLRTKFPQEIAAIDQVHLSKEARAKALAVPSK